LYVSAKNFALFWLPIHSCRSSMFLRMIVRFIASAEDSETNFLDRNSAILPCPRRNSPNTPRLIWSDGNGVVRILHCGTEDLS
jgi:hypothetical protein